MSGLPVRGKLIGLCLRRLFLGTFRDSGGIPGVSGVPLKEPSQGAWGRGAPRFKGEGGVFPQIFFPQGLNPFGGPLIFPQGGPRVSLIGVPPFKGLKVGAGGYNPGVPPGDPFLGATVCPGTLYFGGAFVCGDPFGFGGRGGLPNILRDTKGGGT